MYDANRPSFSALSELQICNGRWSMGCGDG